MKVLEYLGLDTSGVSTAYRKVVAAIERDDFAGAQVKKLVSLNHGKFYRAKLGEADRLLFSLVRHGEQVCALMLEVILNHDYDKSRFLRGAAVDESRIADVVTLDLPEARREAQVLRYLHPDSPIIHLLDKPMSFDVAQDDIFRQLPPLIVVGSAGSGKTALTLEKLKQANGDVLYVTHSAFLARNARDLYYANRYEQPEQDALFLSYREFLESIRVPPGREALWRDFAGWFERVRVGFKGIDAHQAFEEIRGVITADSAGVLGRSAYLGLGIRQSIFSDEQRPALYDLFEKYRAWLEASGLFDVNLVAQQWQALAAPRYDFVVIDEVQDLTAIQLALVLRTLKQPGQFLLCGDSNQIVHPNFFSWATVRSVFWHDPALAERQALRVLTANFRNGTEATRVANQLLKIKQQRFGSIDRESNFLVSSVGGTAGQVALMADKESVKRDLDRQTRQSTRFAVLVMRDEDKPAARQHFGTPLLFSIHEAKGLEYDNIVLYRFVSDHRAEFAGIAEGVDKQALHIETLDYRRARDKSDKSMEVYKFFVNALYVALTRAISNLYLVESDISHPLFDLLDLTTGGAVQVDASRSSMEDWQKEAHKLELQGKQEQAEAIRRDILRQTTVPWPVFDTDKTRELLINVLRDQIPGNKQRQQLYDIATCFDLPMLAKWLVVDAKFDVARNFESQRTALQGKSYSPYFTNHVKDILRQCDQYGVDHRLPLNQTPLMVAAIAGNVVLIDALLERGADREAVDHYGWNALHWAMREAFLDKEFARGPFALLYELLAPPSIDVSSGDRLVRIDKHLAEYFLFQTMWVLFSSRFTQSQRRPYAAFESAAIVDAWQHMPANVVRPERRQRQHISGVLARNEVERDYVYNRALFVRVMQGWYQFNPCLRVRRSVQGSDIWVPVFEVLNLPLIREFATGFIADRITRYLQSGGLPAPAPQIVSERNLERAEPWQRASTR
ncbi:MAG: hypothetical protein ACI8WM_002430 [Burkholderiaceae bacterium]|jgi:hypothetical protein